MKEKKKKRVLYAVRLLHNIPHLPNIIIITLSEIVSSVYYLNVSAAFLIYYRNVIFPPSFVCVAQFFFTSFLFFQR